MIFTSPSHYPIPITAHYMKWFIVCYWLGDHNWGGGAVRGLDFAFVSEQVTEHLRPLFLHPRFCLILTPWVHGNEEWNSVAEINHILAMVSFFWNLSQHLFLINDSYWPSLSPIKHTWLSSPFKKYFILIFYRLFIFLTCSNCYSYQSIFMDHRVILCNFSFKNWHPHME